MEDINLQSITNTDLADLIVNLQIIDQADWVWLEEVARRLRQKPDPQRDEL